MRQNNNNCSEDDYDDDKEGFEIQHQLLLTYEEKIRSINKKRQKQP